MEYFPDLQQVVRLLVPTVARIGMIGRGLPVYNSFTDTYSKLFIDEIACNDAGKYNPCGKA